MVNITSNIPKHRKIIFEGDSLTEYGTAMLPGARTLKTNVQTSILAIPKVANVFDYSLAGTQLDELLTRINTWIYQVNEGDIIHIWCGTNDIKNGGFTGAQTYARLLLCTAPLIAKGAKICVATMIASDKVGDPVDIETNRLAYNALIRTGGFHAVADIGADPVFDAQTDCHNGTYYHTDFRHLVTSGITTASTISYNAIAALL